MGDTGSLSLGGSLGAVGIITKHEIVLAITGGLFVLEAFSVMVQVISFKLTGKRIFKMAPIHHHFEKKDGRVDCSYQILDYINYISNDWSCHFKIKIMKTDLNIFFLKKILIYGLGRSGLSTFNFLKKKIIFFCMMILKRT